MATRNQVFISYAREDASWRDHFTEMFAPEVRRGTITLWSDENIAIGQNWSTNIESALDSSCACFSPSDLEGKRQFFEALAAGRGRWSLRSPEFAGLVSRMLRIKPSERWHSMRDVRHFLRDLEVAESEKEIDRNAPRPATCDCSSEVPNGSCSRTSIGSCSMCVPR